MTVIRPNSVSGINSITAQSDEIKVFKSDGTQGGLIIGGANLNATSGISTLLALNVTGNVSIAGTLTYQDVTNVDSLGIGTFRTGINVSGGQLDVGSNIKLGNAGVITATTFSGNPSGTGNIDAGILDLKTGGNLRLRFSSGGTAQFRGDTDPIANFDRGSANSTNVKWGYLGADRGIISSISNEFRIAASGTIPMTFHSNSNERLRIQPNGRVGIGTDNPPDCTLTVCEFNSGTNIYDNIALRLQGSTGQNVAIQFTDTTGAAAYIAVQGDALRLGTNNAEKLRIDSSGHIGIGTDNPSTSLQGAWNKALVISAGTSNGSMIRFIESSSAAGGTNTGLLVGQHSNNSYIVNYQNGFMSLRTNNAERFRIGDSGQLGIGGATYGSSGQVLTSGGSGSAPTWSTVASGGASNISFNSGYGIDFSATADGTGSSQAELLDDYEEGSWSPAVSSGNASFSTLIGRYTKIGNQVTLWVRIAGGSSYSGSSALVINGLPFTNNTPFNPIGTSEYYKIDFARDFSDHVTPYLAGQNLQWLRNGSGGGSGNYLTINLFYTGAAIQTVITYMTNS